MYKKLKSLSDKFNGNISFINQFKIEELIEISKLAAISSINFINEEDLKYINEINNYSVEVNDGLITKIIATTNINNYKNIQIEINCNYVIVSKQNEHTKYEKIIEIPIEFIKLLLDYMVEYNKINICKNENKE